MPICFSYFILRWLSNFNNSERYLNVRTVLMWGIGSFADLPGTQQVFLLCFLGVMKIKIFAGLFHFVLIALV